MNRLPFMIIFLVSALSGSCQSNMQHIRFSPAEQRFLSSFKIGDSLFFQDEELATDTIIISSIDSSEYIERFNKTFKIYKSVSVWAKSIPGDTIFQHFFQQQEDTVRNGEPKNMFTLKKEKNDKEAKFYYNIKNMIGGKSYWLTSPDTVRINGNLIKNCYVVYTGTNNGYANEIYLTLTQGLIGYKYGGKTWIRKALQKPKGR